MEHDMKALASVLMTALGAAMVLASDLLIRARGIDNTHGIEAHSWDVVGTIVLMLGMGGFLFSCLFDD